MSTSLLNGVGMGPSEGAQSFPIGLTTVFLFCATGVLCALLLNKPAVSILAASMLGLGLLSGLWLLRQGSRTTLCLVLLLSVVSLGYEAGFQVSEALYGLYYMCYLTGWFFVRLIVTREPITAYAGDRAMLAFIVLIVASSLWSFPMGATVEGYISGMSALAFFAFYFPIREAGVRGRQDLTLVVGVFFAIVVFVVVRNLMMYDEMVANAIAAEYVRNRRVDTNNSVVMTGAVMSMALLSSARRWQERLIFAILLVGCSLAILITLSRALWVVTALGLVLVPLLGRGRQRFEGIAWLVAGGTLAFALLLLFAGDRFSIVLEGLISRFGTIQGAATRDISLISRFYEGRAALDHLGPNVVLGQGVGISFSWWDIILQHTSTATHIHNGYISLLYRFGLWGVLLVSIAWSGSIRRGLVAARMHHLTPLARAIGLGSAIALLCFIVSTFTANPFHNSDSIFMFAYIAALAAGVHAHGQLPNATTPPVPTP